MGPNRAIRRYDLSGDWFDMGRQLGERVGGDIAGFNARYFSDAFNLIRFGSREKLEAYVGRVHQILGEYSDSGRSLVAGIAAGAKLPEEQVLMQALLPELTHVNSDRDWPGVRAGCTNACVSSSRSAAHGVLIGQCWDFNIDLPDWYVATLTPPLGLPQILVVGAGSFFCCSGINGMGLAVTFTSSGHLPNVGPGVGVPLTVLLLEALCREGYYEAMDTLVAPKRAGSFNALLTDGYAKSAVVEAAVDRVELIEDESVLVCSNHYQHPTMVQGTGQDLSPPEPPAQEFARSTVGRAQRLRTLLERAPGGKVGLEYLKACLKDHEGHPLSICAHEEGTILHFRTLGAMVLEPAMRTIHFCPGPPCQGKFQMFSL